MKLSIEEAASKAAINNPHDSSPIKKMMLDSKRVDSGDTLVAIANTHSLESLYMTLLGYLTLLQSLLLRFTMTDEREKEWLSHRTVRLLAYVSSKTMIAKVHTHPSPCTRRYLKIFLYQ